MSGFSAKWLALREPYDGAARNRAVLDAVAAAFAGASGVAVTDLGCGTGSTLRAVSPLLPASQRWRLVDNDEALLAAARAATPAGVAVTTAAIDLARDLETALDACDLVTTSALLDLVSPAWLDRLVAAMVRLSRPLYAALSYDGIVEMAPVTRHDATVIAAFNRHQLTDKGFGPALGPGVARTAPERFRAAGFEVVEGGSDWRFGTQDRDIQMEILAGFAGAAGEIGVDAATCAQWLTERREHVTAGRSRMRVGHIDFLACPSGRR
jgi:SAM-dependent methyltransferase